MADPTREQVLDAITVNVLAGRRSAPLGMARRLNAAADAVMALLDETPQPKVLAVTEAAGLRERLDGLTASVEAEADIIAENTGGIYDSAAVARILRALIFDEDAAHADPAGEATQEPSS